jgi:hypothetical protein
MHVDKRRSADLKALVFLGRCSLLWLAASFLPPLFFLPIALQDDGQQRARAVLEAATQAMGGEKFLNARTVIGKGMYTRFDEKGELNFLASFIDSIAYPDKERTEFGHGKKRFIQTNVGATGWIYDAPQKAIRDQTEEQVEDFKRGLRRNLDSILRRWRNPGVQLRYVGEKEIGFRQRGQGVEITFPLDGEGKEVVTIYVDPQTHYPVKLAYDNEEDRFFLFREFDGIIMPLRIDHYEDGVLRARISYNSAQFNQPIDPQLFEKPSHPDKVK